MSALAVESPSLVRPATRRGRGWWLKRIAAVLAAVVIELAATGLVYQAIATESDRRNLPAPGSLIDIGGRQLHVKCDGQGGPTVILETGLGAFSSHSALIQPSITEHTRVCSYDRNEVVGLVLADPTPVSLFERLPVTRRDFSNVEQQARAFSWLAPFGVVRLLIPSAIGSQAAAYPVRTREEIVALNSAGAQWQGVAAELEALPSSMAQVALASDLGLRPLVVLSSTGGSAASPEDARVKLLLDAETAALSSNNRHVVVDGATHLGLASDPTYARVTTDAILQVIGR